MMSLCLVQREEQAALWHCFAYPSVRAGLAETKNNLWVSHTAFFWLRAFGSLHFCPSSSPCWSSCLTSSREDEGIQSSNFPLSALRELNQGVSYVRYLAANQSSWWGKGGTSPTFLVKAFLSAAVFNGTSRLKVELIERFDQFPLRHEGVCKNTVLWESAALPS